ncbi:hypothetical protein L1887_43995 [Cichorium endivia]|nr:hypothetical protein L1887_43995 [Cichorium endivia]
MHGSARPSWQPSPAQPLSAYCCQRHPTAAPFPIAIAISFSFSFCFFRMAAWLEATPGPCGRSAACAGAARCNAPRLSAAGPLPLPHGSSADGPTKCEARLSPAKASPKNGPKSQRPPHAIGSHFALAPCSATHDSHPTILPLPSPPSSSSRRTQRHKHPLTTIRASPFHPKLTRPLHSQPSTLGAWESCIHRRPSSSIRFVALLASVHPPNRPPEPHFIRPTQRSWELELQLDLAPLHVGSIPIHR